MRHVVVFSGGCDSTLLLCEVASRMDKVKDELHVVSVDHTLLDRNKRAREIEARNNIVSRLRADGYILEHSNIHVDYQGNLWNCHNGGLTQPTLWIANIFPLLSDNDILYFGYVRGDDMFHRKSDFLDIIDAHAKMMNKTIQVEFPLEWVEKSEVISRLLRLDLYDKVWYCESPSSDTDVPCGNCEPCIHHLSALYELWLRGSDAAYSILQERLETVPGAVKVEESCSTDKVREIDALHTRLNDMETYSTGEIYD